MKESPAHALAEALCECRASVVSTSPLRNTRFLFLRKALAHFAIHPLRADLRRCAVKSLEWSSRNSGADATQLLLTVSAVAKINSA